jgi:hypothetical protein
VVTVVVFHSDQALVQELMTAIDNNCSCQESNVCSAHRAMLEQRFADGVLWGRWMRQRLLGEEFSRAKRRRS